MPPADGRAVESGYQCVPGGVAALNASHDTSGFQFPNVPLGLSFHAQTCSV